MRRQIVIMLLGLMTTLSHPAFAIAGSRESEHAPQPYKYIGKELDHTHGLNWYDHGARHYDPITGRWNTMDPMCEKYYGTSPYASCGDDPVNYTDITGDTIDMKQVLILDKIYNTNVNDKINTDLSFLTGLTISTSPNGVMTYAKDNEGHPIINSVESSSAIA